MGKPNTTGNQSRDPSQSNRGRGLWNNNPGCGRDAVEIVVVLGVEDEVEVAEAVVQVETVGMVGHLILWLVTGAGCMAIWPMTVLAPPLSHKVVAVLAPLVEVRQDPGNQAQ